MSKLNDLIQELCANGVKCKPIGEIATISRGRVMSKVYIKENEGEYPVYSSQTENGGELGRISTYDFDGEYLTWTTDGANAGSIFHRNGKFNITNVCGLINFNNDEVLVKFGYYFLSIEAKKHVNSGMGNPKLMSNVMAKIKVPLPPLPVQEEIVRILDNFTELTAKLTAELTAELTARKKQYNWYRNLLLSFKNQTSDFENKIFYEQNILDKLEFVKIKDVFQRLKGTAITAGKMREIQNDLGDIRIFAGGKTIIDTFEQDIPKANVIRVPAVLIQSRGIIDVIYYDKPFTFKNEMWAYTHENNIQLKYLYYILKNNIDKFRKAASGMGSMPQISLKVTEDFLIPIPPLQIQEQIVRILDRFDKLCDDISEELHTEIEALQKQYEYYRDKLLTFKPLEEEK